MQLFTKVVSRQSVIRLARFSAAPVARFSAAAVARGNGALITVSIGYSRPGGEEYWTPSGHATGDNTLPIPGYREEGQFATNWELATGVERYEYLKRLKGEDPWPEMNPVEIKAAGTKKNPIVIRGNDPEFYVGCTGFPQDSHEAIWLTLRPHKSVDRCPHCGNVYKYIQDANHFHEGGAGGHHH
ncbi:Cytochrome c oxidase subunit 4 [Irineochytrium annulatum]|nr:Cytochrome c oxidase subunit 4 [Irineochytrium annulatum]